LRSAAERPQTNFETETSAAEFAATYARDALPGGHVIMLSQDPASRDAAFAALRAYPGGMHVGGGITADNARQYLDAGASHVIVTSYVFREGALDESRLDALVRDVAASARALGSGARASGVMTKRPFDAARRTNQPPRVDSSMRRTHETLGC
jgi:phosphoribosylformimino-5-aminoimidazole carboxamide ribotide isomerase